MKILKKLSLLFIIGGLCIGLIILFTNYTIVKNAENKTYNSIENIPYRKVGLLLGTSKRLQGGYDNPYFTHRINAAAELFHAKKISYIIVSGDNSVEHYNESEDMKLDLIKKGVPENRIFEDFAGFRTLDSVVRAKEIFGQNSITVISQKFHNERAIYLAKHHGINAIGYNANDVNSISRKKMKIRESLARTKAVIDVIIGKSPKFSGEKIIIP